MNFERKTKYIRSRYILNLRKKKSDLTDKILVNKKLQVILTGREIF